jgi:metallo-beta-lactamase family protein
MKLTFHGAAHEVTGSCYRVDSQGLSFLVDCGMFQGGRSADQKNRSFPAFDPEEIDFVLLTHAHIDHSGLLPRLAVMGFRGPVYCTRATADLLGVLLLDSAHIQEKEAEWANRAKRKKHSAQKLDQAPLYTVNQAQEFLKRLRPVDYDKTLSVDARIEACFRDAGHILGSASIEVWLREGRKKPTKLVFSGDLGQPGRPLMEDPTPIAEADVLLVESTYGNRLHKDMASTIEELVHAVNDTLVRKKGNVVIPAFAVGRTQEILYLLVDLIRQGRIPRNTAIFVDSPMATKATDLTLKHWRLLDAESQELLEWSRENKHAMPFISFTETPEESMAINKIRQGAIIISASGMCDAGRIKHHLKHNLPRAECTVIIAGFQAAGSLGRRLVDRMSTVRLFQESVPVRADVYTLGGLSAHADRDAVLDWLGKVVKAPKRTFVVHGEGDTAVGFGAAIRERFGWRVEVPENGESFEL